jgi:hypothetical protein
MDEEIRRLFSNFPDQYRAIRFEKTQFPSLESVPACEKYEYPEKGMVQFEMPPGFKGNDTICVAEMSIRRIFDEDPLFFLNLHPTRFDNVKNDLSKGFCYYLWMSHKEDNQREYAEVMDGRHRIVAMLKLGWDAAPFIYPAGKKYLYDEYFTI